MSLPEAHTQEPTSAAATEISPWSEEAYLARQAVTVEARETHAEADIKDVEDMKSVPGQMYIKRSGGAIELWKLTDRVAEDGRPIAESIGATIVNGEFGPAERPFDAEIFSEQSQQQLAKEFLTQQEAQDQEEAANKLVDEQRDREYRAQQARQAAEQALNTQPALTLDRIQTLVTSPVNRDDSVDNLRFNRITVINPQPVEPPKKRGIFGRNK